MTLKQTLKQCRVFEALEDGELDRICGLSRQRQFEAGDTMFSEKSTASDLYVLERGKVALQMQLPAGPQWTRRVTVDVATGGDVFGWSALVEPRKYTLTGVCVEPTSVIAVDGARLKSLLDADQGLGYRVLSRLMGVVASRLDETRRVLMSERQVSTQP